MFRRNYLHKWSCNVVKQCAVATWFPTLPLVDHIAGATELAMLQNPVYTLTGEAQMVAFYEECYKHINQLVAWESNY